MVSQWYSKLSDKELLELSESKIVKANKKLLVDEMKRRIANKLKVS